MPAQYSTFCWWSSLRTAAPAAQRLA